jgi:hypothetical protein
MIPARISVDEVERIVSLYRDRYAGWNVKHFHERAVKQHGLAASYGMLPQDDSRHLWLPALGRQIDLIPN